MSTAITAQYKDFGGGRVDRAAHRQAEPRGDALAGPTSEDREGPFMLIVPQVTFHRSARERDTDAAGHDVIKN